MRRFGLAAAVLILTFYLAPTPANALLVNWTFSQDASVLSGGSASTVLTGTNPLQSPLTLTTDFSGSQQVIPLLMPNSAVTCTTGSGVAHCVSVISPQGSVSITLVWGPLSAGTFNTTVLINDNTGPPGIATGTTVVAPSQPARLAFLVQPTNTIAGATINPAPQVAIQDAAGNPTQATGSVIIQLGANTAGATLSGPTTETAFNGVATFPGLSLDKAGSGYRLTASSAGLTAATSNGFDVTPGSAASLVITAGPADTDAGSALTAVTLVINDTLGNRVTSATNSVTAALGANPGGTTVSGTKTLPAVNRDVTFRDLSLNKVGNGYTLVFTSAGLTGVTSVPFDVIAAAPARLAFVVQPSDVHVGQPIDPPVMVAIEDPFGNVTLSSNPVTIAIGANPGAATLSGLTVEYALNGTATFTGLSVDKSGSGFTLIVTSPGLTGATSNTFSVTQPLVPFHLDVDGLPNFVAQVASFDNNSVQLPFTTFVQAGTSHAYSYPADVAGVFPGTRYHTGDQAQTVFVGSGGFSHTAVYTPQYLLTTGVNCGACAGLVVNVNGAGWYDAGAVATVSAPSSVDNQVDRLQFDFWTGDASGSHLPLQVPMVGPRSVVANYHLQHLLTVSESGLPAGVAWQVQVSATWYPGPFAGWVDDGAFLNLAATSVTGPDHTMYFFEGFVPAPPLQFTQAFATTAQYSVLGPILEQGLSSGAISGPGSGGTINSLSKQFAHLELAIFAGDAAGALTASRSLDNHICGLAHEKITLDFARVLINYVAQADKTIGLDPPPARCNLTPP